MVRIPKQIEYYVNEDGCHICTSHSQDRFGYCQISRGGTVYRMHRFLFEKEHGKLSEEIVLRHTCDNPQCINIAHLVTGTHQDNVSDRVGRGRTANGESHGRAKLTEENVIAIKHSDLPNRELARFYSVDPKTIRNIKQGKTWTMINTGGET